MNKYKAMQVIRRSGGKFDEQQRDILVKMIEALPGGEGGGDGFDISIPPTPKEGGPQDATVWLPGEDLAGGVGLSLVKDGENGYTLSLVVQGEG